MTLFLGHLWGCITCLKLEHVLYLGPRVTTVTFSFDLVIVLSSLHVCLQLATLTMLQKEGSMMSGSFLSNLMLEKKQVFCRFYAKLVQRSALSRKREAKKTVQRYCGNLGVSWVQGPNRYWKDVASFLKIAHFIFNTRVTFDRKIPSKVKKRCTALHLIEWWVYWQVEATISKLKIELINLAIFLKFMVRSESDT